MVIEKQKANTVTTTPPNTKQGRSASPQKMNKPTMDMSKGGYSTKKMRVGGMANCGASMKPAQKAKAK